MAAPLPAGQRPTFISPGVQKRCGNGREFRRDSFQFTCHIALARWILPMPAAVTRFLGTYGIPSLRTPPWVCGSCRAAGWGLSRHPVSPSLSESHQLLPFFLWSFIPAPLPPLLRPQGVSFASLVRACSTSRTEGEAPAALLPKLHRLCGSPTVSRRFLPAYLQ